jgi:ribosome-binding protein aMBF1 (putative translation factor)
VTPAKPSGKRRAIACCADGASRIVEVDTYDRTGAGHLVQSARQGRGLTLRDAAKLCNLRPSVLSGVEMGRLLPDADELAAMLRAIRGAR